MKLETLERSRVPSCGDSHPKVLSSRNVVDDLKEVSWVRISLCPGTLTSAKRETKEESEGRRGVNSRILSFFRSVTT